MTSDNKGDPMPTASFDPDRPIEDDAADRLGFADIAENLAKSVASNSARKGFVIGIEGKWGSGKSSILNLLNHHLQKIERMSVLRFDPWVVGDRDAMVAALIGDLAVAIEETKTKQDGAAGKIKAEAKDLAKQLRTYGATTSRGLSRVAQFGSLVGVPGSDLAAKGLAMVAEIFGRKAPIPPLARQRASLFKALENFDHRFIVMVDDLDRLEPSEAAEIMRLIRAVGDFPNVIYLLCYDKDVLAKSLTTALGVDDGSAFLRKVVQASFRVPRPEEFDLRRWLLADFHAFFQAIHGREIDDQDVRERLAEVCDKEGNLLQTPRDVALVLNALRLVYPAVADKVDFADMCWLQVIRTLDDGLYRWAEQYLTVFAAISGGFGTTSEKERRDLATDLLQLLRDPKGHSFGSAWRLSEIIPGVEGMFDEEKKDLHKLVLKEVRAPALALLEQRRRLGSPQHYRFYFSFSKPAGALDDVVLSGVISDVERAVDIVPRLRELAATPRPQGGTMYGVLLDRLQRAALDGLGKDSSRRLVIAIADTVDDAENKQPRGGPFGQRDNWRGANRLLRSCLKMLSDTERQQFVKDVFANAKSIGWLMESVIGRELFDHGRVGEPRAQPEDWLLKDDELDTAIESLATRLEEGDASRISDVPDLMSFLHRWKQSGREEAMRRWVSDQIEEDAGFVDLLDKCRGWRMSDRIRYPLNKRDVSIFIEFDVMKARLERIAKDERAPEGLRAKANEVLAAAKLGERDFDSG